ncbi:AAA family ATPase [Photobacterium lipolyticum]|uniref:Exonuclease V subunit alpha n=1 Tax=Photobacterium lipolyticum TaxID=266810 RepID=A0A2T3MWH7_9GAMM|nr:AAA family ATPase [Photobacterium lipolyticum]PSW04185.1 exonuclease V subunit alpha [Photobacterium lipolyticum]
MITNQINGSFQGLIKVNSVNRKYESKRFVSFFAVGINPRGKISDTRGMFQVYRLPRHKLCGNSLEVGQFWHVKADVKIEPNVAQDGAVYSTYHLVNVKDMFLTRPSGKHIVWHLTKGKAYKGIGKDKANELWRVFGDKLYQVLDEGDKDQLCKKCDKITERTAQILVDAWKANGDSAKVFKWFAKHEFDGELAQAVYDFHGSHTIKAIEENPYRLLSFVDDKAATFRKIDEFSQETFKIDTCDDRRLMAAVEQSLWALFTNGGHTACTYGQLKVELDKRLTDFVPGAIARVKAIDGCRVLLTEDDCSDYLRLLEPALMEQVVARRIGSLVVGNNSPILNSEDIKQTITEFERSEGFVLNEAQRLSVSTCLANKFSIITGGAGVGKTTVLKAVYKLLDRAGYARVQIALSGRAAREMTRATGEESLTIARYLSRFDWDKDAPDKAYLVIDETSMVDIHLMYKIVRHTPEHIRIVLIGDPFQIPPVGPGLVLHELVNAEYMPCTELTIVKRQGANSDIPVLAKQVRDGEWPQLPVVPTGDVSFLPCAKDDYIGHVLDLLAESSHSTQVLCMQNNIRNKINELAQQRFRSADKELVLYYDEGYVERSGLRLHDPVMCNRNRYDLDLQNGSMGKIVAVYDEGKTVELKDDDTITIITSFGRISWDDGLDREITVDLVDDMELAYAITVHKSQGSQFPRVIVPIFNSIILDRTLIYTAITRAQSQVIMIGDETAARRATKAEPKAFLRQVMLARSIQALLEAA